MESKSQKCHLKKFLGVVIDGQDFEGKEGVLSTSYLSDDGRNFEFNDLS
jgi:hypothetical protein